MLHVNYVDHIKERNESCLYRFRLANLLGYEMAAEYRRESALARKSEFITQKMAEELAQLKAEVAPPPPPGRPSNMSETSFYVDDGTPNIPPSSDDPHPD